MPRFVYTAIDLEGRRQRGEVVADSEAVALDRLSGRGLTPLSISEGQEKLPFWAREFSLTGRSAEMSSADLERLFSGLAVMLQAGFSLPKALAFCEQNARGSIMKRDVARFRDAVDNGEALSDALEGANRQMPSRFLSLVRLGETANDLSGAAERARGMLATETRLRRDLRSALVYPVILLIMALLVMSLIVFYLTPTLVPVFGSVGAEPPALLRVLNALRLALASDWPLVLLAVCAILFGVAVFRSRIKDIFVWMLFRLPLTRSYLKKRETQRIVKAMALMMASGARLPEALKAGEGAATMPAYKALLTKTSDAVAAGQSLANTLAESPLIDDLARAMIQAGAESDTLVELLSAAAQRLEEETSASLAQVMSLLTPALTLLIGGTVGALILATISAILDLNDVAF